MKKFLQFKQTIFNIDSDARKFLFLADTANAYFKIRAKISIFFF